MTQNVKSMTCGILYEYLFKNYEQLYFKKHIKGANRNKKELPIYELLHKINAVGFSLIS